MPVRILRAHESTILSQIGDIISGIIPKNTDVIGKFRHFVEDTDCDQEIMEGEKWVDLFCWSVLGLSSLYFGIVCVSMLISG